MPYRERTAWLSLIAMLVAFTPYFAGVKAGWIVFGRMPDLHLLGCYVAVVAVQVAILAAGTAYLRLKFSAEATEPADERDRAIALRSMRIAYYVLLTGAILVGCVMPFRSVGTEIVNAALFMIVVAELAHYGVMVFSYRRQA